MSFWGDEEGLWWNEPPRQKRGEGPRVLDFNVDRIKIQSDWHCPHTLPELDGFVAVDLETWDPDIHDKGPSWAFPGRGRIVGFAIATADSEWYFPTQHEGDSQNLDHGLVVRWLKAQLAKPTVFPLFANAPYDLGWLKREGIVPYNLPSDVQVMMTLLDEHRFTYALDALGRDLLDRHKDETLLTTAMEQALATIGLKQRIVKQNLWRLPGRYAGPYGEQDARLTFDIHKLLLPRISEEKLDQVYSLEQHMTPIAVDMRWNGVRVDFDKAEQVRTLLQDKENAIIEAIKQRTGVLVDAWDKTAIVRALKTEGIVPPQTAKGQDSVTKQWLAELDHPLAKEIMQLRIYNKSRTTFIDGHVLGHAVDGRIHCQFHQLRSEDEEGTGHGAITGRWSSSDPNLQQLPKRVKEILYLIRTLFLPEEGQKWASLDYSSQEPRLTLHFAALTNQRGAEKAVQQYKDNPRIDYHQMVADLCRITRDNAKPINLGITYGMGGAKLCRELGLPTAWCLVEQSRNGRTIWTDVENLDEVPANKRHLLKEVAGKEGKEILHKYHQGVPFIKGLMNLAMQRGEARGFVSTILGRRCHFESHPRTNEYLELHAALNKIIQGSAADQTKLAMQILYYEKGVTPLITLHDELGLSVDGYDDARMAADVMENAVPLVVPSIVDVKLGINWGDVKDAQPSKLAA